MSENHVCPWWLAYTFDNPLRRLIHNPVRIFDGLVRPGMTVMDVGCGMGYFSIGMAKIVDDSGRVIGVDLQQQMLDIMIKRAARAGVAHRIEPHLSEADKINIGTRIDFILAFWVVHEFPDPAGFFKKAAAVTQTGNCPDQARVFFALLLYGQNHHDLTAVISFFGQLNHSLHDFI